MYQIMDIKGFYFKNLKKLLILPIGLIILSILIISYTYVKTGDFIHKDVTLQGGISATLQIQQEFPELEQQIKKETGKDVLVRVLTEFGSDDQKGIVIESSSITNEELKPILEKITNVEITNENYSVEETGSSLGEAFYKQMVTAIIISFILMSLVILIIYRTIIPSIAVISAAFSDMLVTIAMINLLGISVSTAGIAAILLLIGYSVDTDVLLTTKMLKRKEETIENRMLKSINTGLAMTATTLAALLVGYFISNSFVIKEMFIILIIGLIVDVIMTYILNANILLGYVKKHG